ncbi:MAG TPA: response regulator, partial [Geminicoccaceae bacterium]|nr:response regulator [Geminicoccaceae bacterium]
CQSLLNLLGNAAKFTRDGRVTLTAERLAAEEGGDRLEFRVSDTGIGMTPEQLGRLFQPFSQADAATGRNFGGTGLGLALTRHFCRMLGGDVSVASEYGRGSTFTVTLPADHGTAARAVASGTGDGTATAGTVLVVDDERAVHDLLRRELAGGGYRVLHASGGVEGLRMAREARPDVITLDIIMPDLDGWSVLRALKSDPELRDIPVILVSMLDDREMGFALGAADYLAKPIDRDALLRVLERCRAADGRAEVLVVDDDPDAREVLRRTLRKAGWQVGEAANGREALAYLARSRPGLVLLDLMMPEMDGFETLDTMRREEAWRDIPVVVVTARDLAPEEAAWLRRHAEQVFRKGAYDRVDLIAAVHRMIARRIAARAVA